MALRHNVNGPCSCAKCGGQLLVKLAIGGNFQGHRYIHCLPCGYHFVFPKEDIPHLAAVLANSSQPPAIQGGLNRTVDCSKPGCKRRGCLQCLRRMCKQCCIAQSGCSLRAHNFQQLSARQRSKLPEPTMAFQADDFPLDPSLRHATPLRSPVLPPSTPPPFDDNLIYSSTAEEDQLQYAAAIAASLKLSEMPCTSISASTPPDPASLQGSVAITTAGPSQLQPAARGGSIGPIRSHQKKGG